MVTWSVGTGFGGGFGLVDVGGQAGSERIEVVVLHLAQLGGVAHGQGQGGLVGQAHHDGVLDGGAVPEVRGAGHVQPGDGGHQQKEGEKSALHDF
jgi:hypothetical protein